MWFTVFIKIVKYGGGALFYCAQGNYQSTKGGIKKINKNEPAHIICYYNFMVRQGAPLGSDGCFKYLF